MAIELSREDYQRLVPILQDLPEMFTAQDRRSLLLEVFGGFDQARMIMSRVNLEGRPSTVVLELIRHLTLFGQVSPGREAFGVFLETILKNTGGGENADFIDDVISRYRLIPRGTIVPDAALTVLAASVDRAASGDKYIFISYARSERAIAEQVQNYLVSAGIRTFWDTNNISAGSNWDLTIETALSETTHMVLLLSATSMPYRKEVYREWFAFDQARKPIIPIMVEDCTRHSRLMGINYLDARKGLQAALEQLTKTLSS